MGMIMPFKSHIAPLFRVLLPVLTSPIFDYIIYWTNRFENHKDPFNDEHYIVVKKFAFQFVSYYVNLFYIAFYKQDLSELRSSLIFMLTVNAVIHTVVEWYETNPFVNKLRLSKDTPLQSLLQRETKLRAHDIDDEFLELLLQFGFVSMFSVVFPLAAILAYTNNLLEGSIDLAKLMNSRRYALQLKRCRIGAWQLCFEVISFASVFTNLFFLCICSKHLNQITPKFLDKLADESIEFKLVLMFVLEHLILLLRYLLQAFFQQDSVTILSTKDIEFKASSKSLPGSLSKNSEISVGDSYRPTDVREISSEIPFSMDPMFFIFPFALGPLL